jgi:regulator of sigma E protease
MITLLAFILVLGVIIFVHELGHFLAAKSVGIRVEVFSLGYPPRMVGKKWGETDYRISWIPLGGYTKMAGMVDESGAGSLTGAPWEFQSKNTWQKLWVISAGVLMNLLLGVVVYTGVATFKGLPEPSSAAVVGQIVPGWPAEKAGLQPGDNIVAVNGMPTKDWSDLLDQIHPRAGEKTEIRYVRAGETHQVELVPQAQKMEIQGHTEELGLIGISPEVIFRRAAPIETVIWGATQTGDLIVLVATNLWKLATLKVSIRELGGPIIIAKLSGESAREGLVYLASFIAMISINIGILNLLPIPALDGGHLMIIAGEGIARRRMSLKARLALQQAGMILLLLLIFFVIFNDVQRVFGLTTRLRSLF